MSKKSRLDIVADQLLGADWRREERKDKYKAVVDATRIIVGLNEAIQKREDALKNIFANTIHQEPSVYKSGILGNIEMAVGKEKYKEWEEYYG